MQLEVSKYYPGEAIVNLSDLEEDDRRYFEKDHKNACPGLINVDFYGDGKPTLALLLTRSSSEKRHTEIVMAHRAADGWKMRRLISDDSSLNPPVIWTEPPGKYQDVYGDKTIRAVRPVVVWCYYEASAIVFAWTRDHVEKVWISD